MHNVVVFGASGMLGSAVAKLLEDDSNVRTILPTHKSYDLTEQNSVSTFFRTEDIDTVILCAGKVGGIKANIADPYGFLYQNAMIGLNVINTCHVLNIPHVINVSSSCIYPRECPQPMKEEYMMTGPLEPTNEGYAFGKLLALKLAQIAGYTTVIPCNLYGENDDWTEAGHVMAALIKKLSEEKNNQNDEVLLRGSGKAKREFLHSSDAAGAIVHVMRKLHNGDSVPDLINLGTGEDYSIKELAIMIGEELNYCPTMLWDPSFPDGMPRKVLDVSVMDKLGWKPKVSIREGINKMIEDYNVAQNK